MWLAGLYSSPLEHGIYELLKKAVWIYKEFSCENISCIAILLMSNGGKLLCDFFMYSENMSTGCVLILPFCHEIT